MCNHGFFGTACSIECKGGAQNPCNGNGNCGPDGACQCKRGWVGDACEILCPGGIDAPCNNRGSCYVDGRYAKCLCDAVDDAVVTGYRGDMCETPIYTKRQRNASDTIDDKRATLFVCNSLLYLFYPHAADKCQPETWPIFVPPMVVVGIITWSAIIRCAFQFFDKRIEAARDQAEAIKLASQTASKPSKEKSAASQRSKGVTHSMRPSTGAFKAANPHLKMSQQTS